MINEAAILKLIEEKLSQSELFVTEVNIKQGNNIQVFIDGDREVNIADCVALSRHIESNLNRDEEDFTLQVSSAGVDQPLKSVRQFLKNIGRKLNIELSDGENLTGKLLLADDQKIQVQTEIKKGHRIITGDTIEINHDNIAKAVCLISFK